MPPNADGVTQKETSTFKTLKSLCTLQAEAACPSAAGPLPKTLPQERRTLRPEGPAKLMNREGNGASGGGQLPWSSNAQQPNQGNPMNGSAAPPANVHHGQAGGRWPSLLADLGRRHTAAIEKYRRSSR
jgi:hypothetical protein